LPSAFEMNGSESFVKPRQRASSKQELIISGEETMKRLVLTLGALVILSIPTVPAMATQQQCPLGYTLSTIFFRPEGFPGEGAFPLSVAADINGDGLVCIQDHDQTVSSDKGFKFNVRDNSI
jgi:hypothetical protein